MEKRKLYKKCKAEEQSRNSRKSLVQGKPSKKAWQDEQIGSTSEENLIVEKRTPVKLTPNKIPGYNEDDGTPRKTRPTQVSSSSHIDVISPQKELSLSEESDHEIIPRHGVQKPKPKPVFSRLGEVMVVDALGPRLRPGLTEVTTNTVVSYSPAKVICHSPSPEREKKGKTTPEGAMPEVVEIEVEKSRKLRIGHSTGKTSKGDYGKLIEGSPIDAKSTSRMLIIDDTDQQTKHSDVFLGMAPLDELPTHKDSLNISGKSSDKGSFNSIGPIETAITTSSEKTKKKKKKVRVVSSRYMDPSFSRSRTEDKSKNDRSQLQKPKRDTSRDRLFISHNTKRDSPFSIGRPVDSFNNDLSAITPYVAADKSVNGKMTSTPFANDKGKSEIADGSYLDVAGNEKHGAKLKTTVTTGPRFRKMDGGNQRGTTAEIFKHKLSKNKLQQERLKEEMKAVTTKDNTKPTEKAAVHSEVAPYASYVRMLQAMHLRVRAEHTFDQQEKEAKYQMYKLWQENQKLRRQVDSIERAVEIKKHEMALDQSLKTQMDGLGPIETSLQTLDDHYSEMASALDSRRHYLPVQDIVIPSEERLISGLEESCTLLSSISSITRDKQQKVNEMATDMKALSETCNALLSETESCQDMLIGATSLVHQERSLQVTIFQRERKVA